MCDNELTIYRLQLMKFSVTVIDLDAYIRRKKNQKKPEHPPTGSRAKRNSVKLKESRKKKIINIADIKNKGNKQKINMK